MQPCERVRTGHGQHGADGVGLGLRVVGCAARRVPRLHLAEILCVRVGHLAGDAARRELVDSAIDVGRHLVEHTRAVRAPGLRAAGGERDKVVAWVDRLVERTQDARACLDAVARHAHVVHAAPVIVLDQRVQPRDDEAQAHDHQHDIARRQHRRMLHARERLLRGRQRVGTRAPPEQRRLFRRASRHDDNSTSM